MTNRKPINHLNVEMSLCDLRDALATLQLIQLATNEEGSIERINQGLNTVFDAIKKPMNDIALEVGLSKDFYQNGETK